MEIFNQSNTSTRNTMPISARKQTKHSSTSSIPFTSFDHVSHESRKYLCQFLQLIPKSTHHPPKQFDQLPFTKDCIPILNVDLNRSRLSICLSTINARFPTLSCEIAHGIEERAVDGPCTSSSISYTLIKDTAAHSAGGEWTDTGYIVGMCECH